MKYRKLPIAWTVAWWILAVLLVVLWVRSYSLSYKSQEGQRFISLNGWLAIMDNSEYASAGDTDNGIPIPYWLLTLPIIVIAINSLRPWRDGLRRFSLRTLLIATTLVAVMLGLIVYAVGR
jgi:hypothetical protein